MALVDDTGRREFSAICADSRLDWCSRFVHENVLPRMHSTVPRLARPQLAMAVLDFVGPAPQFWAWFPSVSDIRGLAETGDAAELHAQFADWDHQLLSGLFDQRPAGWPPRCHDLHALADETGIERPANPNSHDPLADAHWGRLIWLNAQPAHSHTLAP